MANINPSAPVVENSVPGRTNFNLSCCRAFSMALGPCVPAYVKEVLPADKWRIKPILRVRTLPLASALLGSFTLRVAWFYESDSNLYGYLDNDDVVTGDNLLNMNLHTIKPAPVSGNTNAPKTRGTFCNTVSSGSLANFLYAPVGYQPCYSFNSGTPTGVPFSFDAGRWFGFWDIYRNFYVNPQVAQFPYFRAVDNTDINTAIYYGTQTFKALNQVFKTLRSIDNPNSLDSYFSSYASVFNSISGIVDASFGASDVSSGVPASPYEQPSALAGLPLCCLRADVFTRMMSTTNSSSLTTFQTNVGSLITASRRFAFLNNIDITGGRVSDWMRFRWGVDIKRGIDKPICLSVDTITLNVDDLRTTYGSETTPAATQVGYIDLGSKLSKVSFNNKTGFGGNIFCIITIVPNVYYSQGFEMETLATKFSDKYNPEFANENFVGVPRAVLGALCDRTDGEPQSANNLFTTYGRTTSWWHYQTDTNRSYGELSANGSLRPWILSRNFYESRSDSISASENFSNSPYCYPHHYNYAFADTSLTSQNFIVQFGADINVSRIMPSYNQPTIK